MSHLYSGPDRKSVPPASERVNNVVAEVFQVATIAVIAVLGILTVAVTI